MGENKEKIIEPITMMEGLNYRLYKLEYDDGRVR